MKASPEETAIVQAELQSVVKAATEAAKATDTDAMLSQLVAVRDRIIGACITIKAIEDAVRGRAMRKLEDA